MDTQSLSESVARAYRSIRERIFDGSLTPGQELRESVLGEEIGVSRTPVRSALSLLEAEGLVIHERYRRYTVASLTIEEIDKIFELRMLLEGLAAQRAATRVTDDEIAELRRLNVEMLVCAGAQDVHDTRQYDELNTRFHVVILRAADSARLSAMLGSLIDLPLSFLSHYQPDLHRHFERSCQHHDEIIRALEQRNGTWAEAQMRAHLLSVRPGCPGSSF